MTSFSFNRVLFYLLLMCLSVHLVFFGGGGLYCFVLRCLRWKKALVNVSLVTKPNNYDIDLTELRFTHEILLSKSSVIFSDHFLRLTVSVVCMSCCKYWREQTMNRRILTSQSWQGNVKNMSSIFYISTRWYTKLHMSVHFGWEGQQRNCYHVVVLFNSLERNTKHNTAIWNMIIGYLLKINFSFDLFD